MSWLPLLNNGVEIDDVAIDDIAIDVEFILPIASKQILDTPDVVLKKVN